MNATEAMRRFADEIEASSQKFYTVTQVLQGLQRARYLCRMDRVGDARNRHGSKYGPGGRLRKATRRRVSG